jgi:hypothetical protein
MKSRFEIVADTFDRGDDRKPDKGRNQPVFNRRGTRFIFPESLYQVHHLFLKGGEELLKTYQKMK